jgi:hypothetical protein
MYVVSWPSPAVRITVLPGSGWVIASMRLIGTGPLD